MHKYFILLFTLFLTSLHAQYTPAPAPPQAQPIVVRGATAHLGNGQVIENSIVAFTDGKLTFVGSANSAPPFPNHMEVDGGGKQLYPGLIAPNTTLGLNEIGLVRATNDHGEIGSENPNIRSIIAYNTDSEITPTVRSMGILLAEVTPTGGRISGTSSVVQMDAWNWEDAAYAMDFAVHVNWPRLSSWSWAVRRRMKNEKYVEQIKELDRLFAQAAAYHEKIEAGTVNLRFEALNGLFDGNKKLFIHANEVQTIEAAVIWAEKYGITPTIVGGRDSWIMTDFLKNHNVAIVLRSTQSLPGRMDSDIDQPFKTPAKLQAGGVLWCFGHEGYWQQRNLPFQAGQAVGYGLEYEEAISALTLNTAKILGIDNTCGSVEEGKDATFILCEGDVLDMRTSKVSKAWIQGREINLDNKQEMLYRKFKNKYEGR